MRAASLLGIRLALGVALLAPLACVSALRDPLGKQDALEVAQQRYTELVRWGEIENASQFVDPAQVERYRERGALLAQLRFTDFESGPIAFGDGSDTATVEVVYHAYSTRTLVEKSIRERQEWYRDSTVNDTWRVRTNLELAAAELGGAR